ncbi:MAG: PepSY domain-containing protein [Thermostichales cyanobacterium HHBFW_bins_127]
MNLVKSLGPSWLLTWSLLIPAFAQSAGIPMPIEEAIAIARRAVPGQMIVEAELKHSRSVWKIKFADRVEVYIDAMTGRVIKVEMDDF